MFTHMCSPSLARQVQGKAGNTTLKFPLRFIKMVKPVLAQGRDFLPTDILSPLFCFFP